jgi:prepilin-type N-terminal cleavage/methylation domain-containing protein/prepilin-type processing-associated H-X9-DG protein
MIMNTTRRFVFKKAPGGFTLVELLVVLAVIAVLAVLLLPAIAATKPNSQGFQCLNNEKQLTLAWQMYAEDNADTLPPNDFPYATAYRGYANQSWMKNWVVGTMEQAVDVASPQELTDPNTLLSAYVTNPAVYRCPADNFIDPGAHRVHPRSYSMNSAVGTLWWSHFPAAGVNPVPAIGSPVQGGWLSGASYNSCQTTWLTYGKMSSLSRPGPAHTLVFMEENPLSINDGSIAIPAFAAPGATYIIDWAAGNHDGGASISFADGHVIVHRWLDSRTFTPTISIAQHGQGGTGQTLQTPDNPDCFYLAPITSAPR